MHVVLEFPGVIPALKYGGIERVIWYLGKELVKRGHKVTYMVGAGSTCDFGNVIPVATKDDIIRKMPSDADIVHFSRTPVPEAGKPYVYTLHGNEGDSDEFDVNTIFISRDHAQRFGSDCFVYNGLDWDDYGSPALNQARSYFHFLGNAAWRKKNVKGAIAVIRKTKRETLHVLGGKRLNFKMGFRLTLTPRVKFHGMVGGDEKMNLLRGSKGLIFPVRWHEPFGLAIIESLFFGCPIFGTPYGALPELVNSSVGYLADNAVDLARAIQESDNFSKRHCHEYAVDMFNSSKMADAYVPLYDKVLNGQSLNPSKPKASRQGDAKFLKWE